MKDLLLKADTQKVIPNNVVIKNLTPSMGFEIIKYFEGFGYKETNNFCGSCCELEKDTDIYYGVINGKFSNYSIKEVQEANAQIIQLPRT
jgi:hypothetical protein